MFRPLPIGEKLQKILSPYLESIKSDDICYKLVNSLNKSSNPVKIIYSTKWLVWKENIDQFSSKELYLPQNNLQATFYQICLCSVDYKVGSIEDNYHLAKKYKTYDIIYEGVENKKQYFTLIEDSILIADECMVFLYSINIKKLKKATLPDNFKNSYPSLTIKAVFCSKETNFILIKEKNKEVKTLSFLRFSTKKGKINFEGSPIRFCPDHRIRWKTFYHENNQCMSLENIFYFGCKNIIYLTDVKTGELLQIIPFFQEDHQRIMEKCYFSKYNSKLVFVRSDKGNLYILQNKNTSLSKISEVFNLGQENILDRRLMSLLGKKNLEKCEQEKVLDMISQIWSLKFSNLSQNDYEELDISSKQIFSFLIRQKISNSEKADFFRFTIYFFLKYSPGKVLKLLKILKFIYYDLINIDKIKNFEDIPNLLPFLTNTSTKQLTVESDDIELLEEFKIDKNEFNHELIVICFHKLSKNSL